MTVRAQGSDTSMGTYEALLHFGLWYALFNEYSRCIFYLVCESSCVVGDKMKVSLEQVQIAVMHILKEQTHSHQLSIETIRGIILGNAAL